MGFVGLYLYGLLPIIIAFNFLPLLSNLYLAIFLKKEVNSFCVIILQFIVHKLKRSTF